MKTPLAALFAFTLLATSTATYQCLDSAPNLQCCQNHPYSCQILRDPDQDPSNPPGASYQPADLNAFSAACTRLNGASWPACCYIDAKITSCNRAFNVKNRRQNRKIANWGTLEGYATAIPVGTYQTQIPKELGG
ncbi:hypothetical protein VF21_06379 [Pseudogymnoascus sp. 05NY08]|nr:hypothetical protein VF21_06379 [Pseudogymnoascus sp. 05NY08]